MTLAVTKIAEINAAASATFTAPTTGALLVCHVRRNNLATTAAIALAGWTEAAQAGPGDAVTSERAACFWKVSDGTETSVAPTNMTAGTRQIEVYSVAVPAGAGGNWRKLASATQSTAVAGLTTLASADVLSECSDMALFAQAIYSSSVTAGNEGVWPGFHFRHTSSRFSGSTGTLMSGKSAAWDSTFTWVADTRRAAGTNVAFGYVIAPSVSVSSPPAASSLYGSQTLQATVSGGNIDAATVEFWRDIATDTLIGSVSASPWSIAWNTDAETNGALTVYAKVITVQTLDTRTGTGRSFTIADAPIAATNAIGFKYHNGTTWVDITAIKQHNGTTWVTVWP